MSVHYLYLLPGLYELHIQAFQQFEEILLPKRMFLDFKQYLLLKRYYFTQREPQSADKLHIGSKNIHV